jgi:hypothetical protein
MPFWHFISDKENVENSLRITEYLHNNNSIRNALLMNDMVLGMRQTKWNGVFGVQSFINLDFLCYINNKYNLTQLIHPVTCRKDRCCLERIIGCIFYIEYKQLYRMKSIFGNIFNYKNVWKYSFDDYEKDVNDEDNDNDENHKNNDSNNNDYDDLAF